MAFILKMFHRHNYLDTPGKAMLKTCSCGASRWGLYSEDDR